MEILKTITGTLDEGIWKFPTLYQYDSNERPRIWNIYVALVKRDDKTLINIKKEWLEVRNNILGTLAVYWTVSGLIDGEKTSSEKTIIEKGVNIGKSNETTVLEQALLEAFSAYNDKIKSGYNKELTKTSNNKRVFPVALQNYRKFGHKITFPALVSPKLDGNRGIIDIDPTTNTIDFYTRRLTDFNSDYLIDDAKKIMKYLNTRTIFDCEIYEENKPLDEITSSTRKLKNEANETYPANCFDVYIPSMANLPFISRYNILQKTIESVQSMENLRNIKLVKQHEVKNTDEVDSYYKKYVLDEGNEGLVVRNTNGIYETGTKEMRSYDVQKYKPLEDKEFICVGFVNGGKGKMDGTIKFVLSTESNRTFNVNLKGMNLKERSEEYKKCKEIDGYFDSKYKGRYGVVRYARINEKTGLPQQPVLLRFINV